MLRFTMIAMIAVIGLLTFTQANAMDGLSRSDVTVARAEAEQELKTLKRDYQQSIRDRLVTTEISTESVAKVLIDDNEGFEKGVAVGNGLTDSFESQSLTKLEVAKPWILASGNSSLDIYKGESARTLQPSKFTPAQGD